MANWEWGGWGESKSGLISLLANPLESLGVQSPEIPTLFIAWPVGSIYESVEVTDPGIVLGYGTWQAFGAGKVLVGYDSADADFDLVEETGGAKTHTHSASSGSVVSNTGANVKIDNASNMPPYIVVYRWKRIS